MILKLLCVGYIQRVYCYAIVIWIKYTLKRVKFSGMAGDNRNDTEHRRSSMSTDLPKRKVLIVSDHERFSRALELIMSNRPDVEIIKLEPNTSSCQERSNLNGDLDLIILALGSPNSEPLVVLTRNWLMEQVGQVPLLILSDRPFDCDLENRIFSLDLPFAAGRFRDKVTEILQTT